MRRTGSGYAPGRESGYVTPRARAAYPLAMSAHSAVAWLAGALLLACATGPDPFRYRLANSGGSWLESGDDAVLADLESRYPDYFRLVFDQKTSEDIDLRPLRDDLERSPVDRRNYDALNAVAIGYFELNARAEDQRGSGGSAYLGGSFRVAKLVAVPWRAYREIHDTRLRDAILDFFADAARGDKPASLGTSSRLARIVASLGEREPDPARQARIRAIARELRGARPESPAPF